MAEPHHHRKVGYSMIVVSASLAVIGLLQLGIGENVLFGDDIQRAKTAEFEHCNEIDFVGEECRKFDGRIKANERIVGQEISDELDNGVEATSP